MTNTKTPRQILETRGAQLVRKGRTVGLTRDELAEVKVLADLLAGTNYSGLR